jgi:hypothetical protein
MTWNEQGANRCVFMPSKQERSRSNSGDGDALLLSPRVLVGMGMSLLSETHFGEQGMCSPCSFAFRLVQDVNGGGV